MIGTVWRNKHTGVKYEVIDVKQYHNGVEVICFSAISNNVRNFDERWEKNIFMEHWEIVGY